MHGNENKTNRFYVDSSIFLKVVALLKIFEFLICEEFSVDFYLSNEMKGSFRALNNELVC